MTSPARLFLAGIVALSGAGCAHVPSTAERATPEKPERVLVTGSRIPRPVDPRTGLPTSISPVSLITQEDILATGRSGDLGAALRRLELATATGR